jgi:MYXO-CTERM domain-containing protein
MRTPPIPSLTLLALLALLAWTPFAAAQDDDGCSHADPCPWVVDVDDKGFQSYVEDQVTFTLGDWYEILVFNDDTNRSHTLTLSGHDKTVTVEADGFATDTGAFQFNKAGDFQLKDSPTGDTIAVHVVQGDAVAAEESSSSSGAKDGSALPFVLAAMALLGLALFRRR